MAIVACQLQFAHKCSPCTRISEMGYYMRRMLVGMIAIGWLGCNTMDQSESTSGVREEALQSSQFTAPPTDLAMQPNFNQCLAGQTCAPIGGCNGTSNNVPCGVNRVCCTPSTCAGMCVSGTNCPGGQPILGSCSTTAVCCPALGCGPNGGGVCLPTNTCTNPIPNGRCSTNNVCCPVLEQ